MRIISALAVSAALLLSGCAVNNKTIVNDVATVVGLDIGYQNYSFRLGLVRHEYTTVPLSNGVPNMVSQTSTRLSPLGTSVVYRKFATGDAASIVTEMPVPLTGDVIQGPWAVTLKPLPVPPAK